MKEIELKHCPFCGGKAEIKKGKAYLYDCVQAHCTECGVFMPKVVVNHLLYTEGKQIYITETMAREKTANAWNRRSENTIELPCKIGDTVYIIDEAEDECGEDYVLAVKVLQFFINEHGIAIELALPLGMRLNTWMVVGENVFLTEEEAEKVLAERSRQ